MCCSTALHVVLLESTELLSSGLLLEESSSVDSKSHLVCKTKERPFKTKERLTRLFVTFIFVLELREDEYMDSALETQCFTASLSL